jgi:hypothetical protein
MYELRGQFFEACDCYVVCPCWVNEDPDDGYCNGAFGWYVEQGEIDGVDVSGLCAASVSRHDGHRQSGGWRVVLYVDERASEEQRRALEQVFSGKSGGPLGELGNLTDEVLEVESAAIELTSDGGASKLRVGQEVSADLQPLVGSTGRVTTLADSALATTFGTPAELGKSSSYRISVPRHGFELDVQGRSANRGRFYYTSDGYATT